VLDRIWLIEGDSIGRGTENRKRAEKRWHCDHILFGERVTSLGVCNFAW
jgi:hypothetical protein